MTTCSVRRAALCVALLGAASPLLAEGPTGPRKIETASYKGKVARLDQELAGAGVKLDRDAAPFWLALITEDGKVFPLIKDSGSRLFFTDPAVRDRPMQLTGYFPGKMPFLRVMSVQSYRNGKLNEVYYWCDICAIRRGERMICECCGGPMVLREDPLE